MLQSIYSDVELIPEELVKNSHVDVRLVAVKDVRTGNIASAETHYVNTVKAMSALVAK